MRIATLGPEGTFSHEALLKYDKKAATLFAGTIRDVFEAVAEGKAGCGVVPIENSVAGTVGQTLDCLMEYKLKVKAEEILLIKHNLAGSGKISGIKKFTCIRRLMGSASFLSKKPCQRLK